MTSRSVALLVALGLVLALGAPLAATAWRISLAPPDSPDLDPLARALVELGHAPTRLEATYLALPGSGIDVLVIPPGARAPTPGEADALLRYLEEGGVVLVLADAATAALLGAEMSPLRVRTDGPGGVEARDARGRTLLLPEAHPVLGAGRVLLESGPGSFVDVDHDGKATAADVAGPFPLGIALRNGAALVLGTPLDEATLRPPAVRTFLADLLKDLAPENARFALDATRGGESPLRDALLGAPHDVATATPLRALVLAGALLAALPPALAAFATRREDAWTPSDPRVPLPEEIA